MSHEHHHLHGVPSQLHEGVFLCCIILNLCYVFCEAFMGVHHHSVSLLSDAGHNFLDASSLILVLIGYHLAKKSSSKLYTYGYRKTTVLLSLLNSLLLMIVVGIIIKEAIEKFISPEPVDGSAMSWTAGLGIVVNSFTAFILVRYGQKDLNVRAASLHILADAIVSISVVISGLLIMWTGAMWIDTVMSLIIAIIVLWAAIHLLTTNIRLFMDGTPQGLSIDHVRESMMQNAEVVDVHHIHLWAISTSECAFTAHVVVRDLMQQEAVRDQLKQQLQEMGIAHATLEMEQQGHPCHDEHC